VSEEQVKEGNPLVLWGVGVLLFGLLLVMHGCARFVGGGGHVYGAQVAEGRVIEVTLRPQDFGRNRGIGTVRETIVEFTVGGKTVRLRDTIGAVGEDKEKGALVPVYYDPASPEKAMIGGNAPFTGLQFFLEWLAGMVTLGAAGYLMYRGAIASRKGK
jgi:hypothetical protein